MDTVEPVRNFTLTKTDTAEGYVDDKSTLGFICELAVTAPDLPRVRVPPTIPPIPQPPSQETTYVWATPAADTKITCIKVAYPCERHCIWLSGSFGGELYWRHTYCNGNIIEPESLNTLD